MTLQFRNVSYRFRRTATPVLSDFSWTIRPGRTVLLGPNGAGKSTLLALGADALLPAAGEITLRGLNPRNRADRAAYRRAVGWAPQQAKALPGLTAREQVAYAGWLKGLTGDAAWTLAMQALAAVGLEERAAERSTRLSGGQLRRVGLAQALVHTPEVLLMDEPTAGLDPEQRARFRELLTALPADQPLVVSTHQVDDLSELFHWVVALFAGEIRFEGTVSDFLALAPHGSERQAEAAYARLAAGSAK